MNLTELLEYPILCVNCAGVIRKHAAALYCSELCSQEAEAVRYFRRCLREGRVNDEKLLRAIRIKFSFIASGRAYPRKERTVPDRVKLAVLERDRHKCRECGASEDLEIDHVAGSSSDPLNLQTLCGLCHLAKTEAQLAPVVTGSPEEKRLRRILARGIAEKHPKACDDPDSWPKVQIEVLRRRQEAINGQASLFS